MFVYPKQYDVLVIGAGHAGVEAALAAARMGCQTLLLTTNLDTIGQMSCNPAIGGLAKGHLAREIDALGGEMGMNTDLTGIQFRMLNTRKGPSVWAPRAQADKKAYQFRLKWICEQQANLDCKQGLTTRILHKDGSAYGVETALEVQFHSKTVVVTTGTFLRGLMHIGANQQAGGRSGEAATTGLSASLIELGLQLGRLKTGTPPRLVRQSIDFSKTESQFGDEPIPAFSYWKEDLFHVEQTLLNPATAPKYPPDSILERIGGQIPCHITYTTERTAELIRQNLHRSPMYSGVIEGTGPRYCPSIEDKIVRFSDKERHQVFLEPEGMSTDEFYVNGFSTCLPFEVQLQLVQSIIGCERAEIMRPAYAVEYDFAFPTQLDHALETRCCRNLFLGGQINGTSGYEEAGAQGIMAGINAARRSQDKSAVVLRRDQAYIGVLIDDLVSKGTSEPYRMFTSRAEFRLLLRQDNADLRLSALGAEIGLLAARRARRVQEKQRLIQQEIQRLETTRSGSTALSQLLRRPEISYRDLESRDDSLSAEVVEQVEIMLKYAGYIDRQELEVRRFRTLEEKQIPSWFKFDSIPSLSTESRIKLSKSRPSTIGQASRISGISPADISLVLVHLKRGPQSLRMPREDDECGSCSPPIEDET